MNIGACQKEEVRVLIEELLRGYLKGGPSSLARVLATTSLSLLYIYQPPCQQARLVYMAHPGPASSSGSVGYNNAYKTQTNKHKPLDCARRQA